MADPVTGSIIMLSGPIGAGKSTVARELAKMATGPTANIEGDKFWSFFAKVSEPFDRKKNFRVMLASMLAAAVPYAVNGYEVILDFAIPPWFLDAARRMTAARHVPLKYIILKPGRDTCAHRAATRSYAVVADYSTVDDFYASFDSTEDHILREETATAAEIAAQIRQRLDNGEFVI